MSVNYTISLIIPVGPDETSLSGVLKDLESQTTLIGLREIIIVSTSSLTQQEQGLAKELSVPVAIIDNCSPGRAQQINHGLNLAQGSHCWILHADTRLHSAVVSILNNHISIFPDALLFFGLTFFDSQSMLMKLTEFGTWFRSHILHIPFGDQGFCMGREHIVALGRFDQKASYGEDHLFLWQWRLSGRKVIPVNTTIATSARKYETKGWFRVTCQHCYLTWKQALPSLYKLLRYKFTR